MRNVIALFLILSFTLTAQDNPYKRNIDQYELKKKIETLEQTSEALKKLHDVLKENSASVKKLNAEASKNIVDELYETYVEASMNLVDKLYTPFNSALELGVDVVKNIFIEDPVWNGSSRKQQFTELKKNIEFRNTKLRLMYNTLAKLSEQPLKRYDDDMEPLPFTKTWWKTGDNEEDDALELRVRKLNVMRNLSQIVYEKTEQELGKIRDERRGVIDELNEAKALYEKGETINKEVSEKTNTLTDNVVKFYMRGSVNDRGEQVEGPRDPLAMDPSNYPPDLKEKVKKYQETQAAEKAKLDELSAERKRLFEERIARWQEATVYIDSDCPRHVYPGEKVLLLAKAHPEDIEGTFKLNVDDRQVNASRKKSNFYSFYYTFMKPGVYDVQVHLYNGSQYVDTYTDQWYVEDIAPAAGAPIPTFAGDNRPNYDPSLEGTTKPAMQNQYVSYNLLYQGGDIYLQGYYYTPTGQKVNYKSKPLAAVLENAPASGLMLTKGGTGYHFYQTTGEVSEGVPYVITRLRGPDITVLHEFKATFINVKNAPDYSRYTVEYKTKGDNTLRTLVLD